MKKKGTHHFSRKAQVSKPKAIVRHLGNKKENLDAYKMKKGEKRERGQVRKLSSNKLKTPVVLLGLPSLLNIGTSSKRGTESGPRMPAAGKIQRTQRKKKRKKPNGKKKEHLCTPSQINHWRKQRNEAGEL